MSDNVPDEVLQATINCKSGFSCLENGKCGKGNLCEINRRIGKDLLALKSKAMACCPYRMSFGGHDVCKCPVHYALFMRGKR